MSASRRLRLLIVDDSSDDATLAVAALRNGGWEPYWERVETPETMLAAIERGCDLVLCEWAIPGFPGPEALELALAQGDELPLVLFSGTIGEEAAVEAMRQGARDFVMKDRIERLVPVIERELKEVEIRRERRRAIATLQESEEQYRGIFEHANDAIVIFDPEDEKIVEVNGKACRLYGFRREEMIGMSMKMLTLDVPRGESQIRELLAEGSYHGFESVQFDSAGRAIDVLINSAVIQFRGRRAVLSINRDISERKRTEKALRESERRLREAQRIAKIGSWCWQIDEDHFEGSEETFRIHGLAPESEIPDTARLMELLAPESRPAMTRVLDELRSGLPAEADVTLLIPDGTRRYAHIQAEHDPASPPGRRRAFGYLQDVTERRLAGDEIFRREQEFKALVESHPDVILRFDRDLRHVYANPAVERQAGVPVAEVLGRTHRELGLPPDLCELLDGALAEVFRTGVEKVIEMTMPLPQGPRTFQARVVPQFGADDRVEFVLALSRDITEIRAHAAELQESQRQLARAQRLSSLGRVAATMSHEFNNVLMGIQPFAEIVARRAADPPMVDAAKRILQSVRRGRSVTSELLRFTRPAPPVTRHVEVSEWLADAVGELRALLPPAVRIELTIADEPLGIAVDRDQLTQVIGNLVLNARDSLAEGAGTIRIAAGRAPDGPAQRDGDGMAQFEIRDDGSGILPEHLDRIFEPFFTTKQSGTGLGLPIVHQIIDLHGGWIDVESPSGCGTTVRFAIPLAVADRPHPAGQNAALTEAAPA